MTIADRVLRREGRWHASRGSADAEMYAELADAQPGTPDDRDRVALRQNAYFVLGFATAVVVLSLLVAVQWLSSWNASSDVGVTLFTATAAFWLGPLLR